MRVGEENRSRQAADCVKWEYGVRVFFYNLYIYGGILVFLTYIYKRVGSGSGFGPGFDKTRTRPGPASGFFLKTHTRPYNLSDRVKSGPLGSGRTGYPRVGYKLPSLVQKHT